MDMEIGFPAIESAAKGLAPPVRLAEHRNRVWTLIREFRRAVERGPSDAIRVLRQMLPCCGAYFATIESPHNEEHRRLLEGMRQSLDRCSGKKGKVVAAELAHALDGLVLHEAETPLRESSDPRVVPLIHANHVYFLSD